MLWVYDHYGYFYSYSAGIDARRQNLSLMSIPALYGLSNATACDLRFRHIFKLYRYLNSFHPVEVVGRGSETQLQVGRDLNQITE